MHAALDAGVGLIDTALGAMRLLAGACPARAWLHLHLHRQREAKVSRGRGVFDVGTGLMLPQGRVEWSMLIMTTRIRITIGMEPRQRRMRIMMTRRSGRTSSRLVFQYMFDRSWGSQVEVPYDDRYFKTTGGASGSDIVALNWASLGDIRVEGIYTGFSPDMSTGINFGFKLPTGDYTHNDAFGDIDRDSELGTGSTDILLGGFPSRESPG